jgi:ABC-type nitrate/sulfonate/bicarbonate transport system substrate-binding protein
MLESHGVSRMLRSFNDIVPGYVFTGVYFSDRYLAAHPNEVRAFLRGLIQSFEYIRTNEKSARRHLPKYTSVSDDVAQKCALRDLSGGGRERLENLDRQRDLLFKFGFFDQKVSLKGIVDYSYLPEEKKGGAR